VSGREGRAATTMHTGTLHRTALDYSTGDVKNADLYISSPLEFTVFINDPLPQ